MNIIALQDRLKEEQAKCGYILDTLDTKEKRITGLQDNQEDLLKARWVLTEVGKGTQEQVKQYIEEMGTLALQSVFEEDYKFKINFNIKRNKPEAELRIQFKGNELDPRGEMGGGVIDVASFALRIVLWTLQTPRTEGVFLLDEPFRFVHGYLDNVGEFLHKICKRLNLQIIIITQLEDLSITADKSFICKHNGVSTDVKEVINVS